MIYKTFAKNSPDLGYWDQSILDEILPKYIGNGGEVVVIPARQNHDKVDEINDYLKGLDWVILILTGDEENVFPIEKIKHDEIRIYQQTPKKRSGLVDLYLPNGYSPHTQRLDIQKDLDWFFAGQVTHKRRQELQSLLSGLGGGRFYGSQGFTQGLSKENYIKLMNRSKVVPCPSGPVTPDTFRLYEALECGCFPIVDKSDYWELVFGENNPLKQVDKVSGYVDNIEYYKDMFPEKNNEILAWWLRYKIELREKIAKDIKEMGGLVSGEDLTIIVPTSSIPEHPSTAIIEETIKSIISRFDVKIILMIDGLREDFKSRKKVYEEYIRRVLEICRKDQNIYPMLHSDHLHQVEMTRQALELVNTKYIMFIEHDTPLCEDIPTSLILDYMDTFNVNVMRLNHEAYILEPHQKMVVGDIDYYYGEIFTPTSQWSQRPHFARTDFYRKILNKYFSKNARCMIEDGIHGKSAQDFNLRGKAGWNDWRIWMYTPEKDQKRSYTIDGRKTDPKFDEKFIY